MIMKKSKKAVSVLLCVLLVISFIGTAFLSVPISVYALPPALLKAKTIGSLILSLLAGANTGIVSPGIIRPIAAYETSQYDLEHLINQGAIYIEGESTEVALRDLGIGRPYNLDATKFKQLIQGNWQSMQQIGMDSVLNLNNLANKGTDGAIQNLGSLMCNLAQYGYLGFENSIAIIANPGTAVSVTFDAIKSAIKSRFNKNVKYKAPLEYSVNLDTNTIKALAGYDIVVKGTDVAYQGKYIACEANGVQGYLIQKSNNLYDFAVYNTNNNTVKCPDSIYTVTYRPDKTNYYISQSGTDLGAYKSRILSTNIEPTDLEYIKPLGNTIIVTEDEFNNIINTGAPFYNTVNPDVNTEYGFPVYGTDLSDDSLVQEGDTINPIDYPTYNTYMGDTINNYTNNNYSQAPTTFNNFVNNYITYYNPDNPVIRPTWAPEPTAAPVVPVQPTYAPPAEVTPIPDDTQTEVLGNRLPDLETKFPFCIPWDIMYCFKRFETTEREAPHITWDFESTIFGDLGTIDIDLKAYDDVAEILRALEIILFLVGLALATRKLIWR